jgi:hypothetical protein
VAVKVAVPTGVLVPMGVLLMMHEAVPPESAPVVHVLVPSEMDTVPVGTPAAPPAGETDTLTV